MESVKPDDARDGEIFPETPSPPHRAFVLAHFSDPHLTSLAGVHLRDLLSKRGLGYLSWWRKRRHHHRPEVLEALLADLGRARVDHTVITGDLTHLGLPSEYRQTLAWLKEWARPEEVTIIPGNHDAYRWSPPAETSELWRPFMRADASPSPPLSDAFPFLRRRGPVALIGLSSAQPTSPVLATGTLGPEQLQRLDRMLAATGREGLVRVVLVHHPPVAGSIPWRKRLTDGAAFAEVLARQGAELVLHGHAHYSLNRDLPGPAGPIPVIGVPSASEISSRRHLRRARYHIYRLEHGEKGWTAQVSIRVFEPDRHAFASERDFCLDLP